MSLTPIGGEEMRMRLHAVPNTLRSELRKNFRQAAGPIVSDMQARASWSSRIPGAIKIQAKFGINTAGVFIRVDSSRAPHARVYELGNEKDKGKKSTFRHPVYGNREAWVDQAKRPFFFAAAKAHRAEVVAAAQAALRIATE